MLLRSLMQWYMCKGFADCHVPRAGALPSPGVLAQILNYVPPSQDDPEGHYIASIINETGRTLTPTGRIGDLQISPNDLVKDFKCISEGGTPGSSRSEPEQTLPSSCTETEDYGPAGPHPFKRDGSGPHLDKRYFLGP